ncbi:MAG: hypothetical protein RL657_2876 [Pseudomonadota bacterium]|jgi:hypothetical protein
MDIIASILIIGGFLVVLVLLLYLIDRVNTLEREARGAKSLAPAVPKGPFAGLAGRKLWDAMAGSPPSGVDAAEWAAVRNRYNLVLQLHIEDVFAEGQRDGQRGMAGEPKNPRLIASPDGPVESWLPLTQLKSIYQAGLDSGTATEEALLGVRVNLNEAGRVLYQQTGMPNCPVQSDLLLPGPLPQLTSWDPAMASPGQSGAPAAPPVPPQA